MKVLITGASGLIGSALASFLAARHWEVIRLVRTGPHSGRAEVFWNPDQNFIDAASLEGIDAAVHLAGENLATGRWTGAKKSRIRDSRVRGTALLSKAIATLRIRPKVFVSASAIGFYGNRGAEALNEQSAPGAGFLASICREWETAASPAEEAGIRVVHSRFGMVLSARGGALAKMLPVFRVGLGGVLAGGEQFWSWIAIDDLVRAMDHLLACEGLSGPINFVSPETVTNREFTRVLAKSLRRPAVFKVPRFALRAMLGEMADELLLSSARVEPAALVASHFTFAFPTLDQALAHVLRT